jgi:hypothetical protein
MTLPETVNEGEKSGAKKKSRGEPCEAARGSKIPFSFLRTLS